VAVRGGGSLRVEGVDAVEASKRDYKEVFMAMKKAGKTKKKAPAKKKAAGKKKK